MPNVFCKVISLIAAGQFLVADLVTHAFPLEQFSTALDVFVNRRDGVIKVVVEPTKLPRVSETTGLARGRPLWVANG